MNRANGFLYVVRDRRGIVEAAPVVYDFDRYDPHRALEDIAVHALADITESSDAGHLGSLSPNVGGAQRSWLAMRVCKSESKERMLGAAATVDNSDQLGTRRRRQRRNILRRHDRRIVFAEVGY